MDAQTKAVLRSAGADAGRRQRRQRGERAHVSDPVVVQRLADLLRKAGERRG